MASNANSSMQRRFAVIASHLSAVESMSQESCDGSSSPPYLKSSGDLLSQLLPNGCLLLTLNRPKALNAISFSMLESLRDVLKHADADLSVKYIVVVGAGDKAFCAGGDIKGIHAWQVQNKKSSEKTAADPVHPGIFFGMEYKLNRRIACLSKPYISLIDGIVMGGGCGVSIHGKFRVVSEKVTLAMPETGIGLFPDVGGSYFLNKCPGAVGMYLGLTGARLNAADCIFSGLATHFIPASRISELKEILCKLENANVESILNMSCVGREQLLKEMPSPLQTQFSLINQHYDSNTHGSVEEIVADLKRGAESGEKWCAEQLEVLSKKSPLSLKLTFKALMQGKEMSLDDCLRMEYAITQGICQVEGDFQEGVRALVIDRDNKPIWKYKTLEEVSAAILDIYFRPVSFDFE